MGIWFVLTFAVNNLFIKKVVFPQLPRSIIGLGVCVSGGGDCAKNLAYQNWEQGAHPHGCAPYPTPSVVPCRLRWQPQRGISRGMPLHRYAAGGARDRKFHNCGHRMTWKVSDSAPGTLEIH